MSVAIKLNAVIATNASNAVMVVLIAVTVKSVWNIAATAMISAHLNVLLELSCFLYELLVYLFMLLLHPISFS